MKRLFTVLALALGFTIEVQAQQFAWSTAWASPGSAANWFVPKGNTNLATTTGYIPCQDYGTISVWIGATATNAAFGGYVTNGTAIVAKLAVAADATGTSVLTNQLIQVVGMLTTNVEGAVACGLTNIDVGAWPYLKVFAVSNSCINITLSNVFVKYAGKPRQREYR